MRFFSSRLIGVPLGNIFMNENGFAEPCREDVSLTRHPSTLFLRLVKLAANWNDLCVVQSSIFHLKFRKKYPDWKLRAPNAYSSEEA